MPFQKNDVPCKKCRKTGQLFRLKWHTQNQRHYLQTTCKECEYLENLEWRKKNKDKWASLVQKSYYKCSEGSVSRRNNMEHTEETRKQWHRDKSNNRCTRAKKARLTDELTQFVTKEAHELRKLRNKVTGFEWHVDHVIPLKGEYVCGLHTWNNLAVIPKVENLRKGNYYSIST